MSGSASFFLVKENRSRRDCASSRDFTILFTHIPLAVLSLPMIIMTVVPALRQRYDRHRSVAKWTVPVWLYVSVTGIIIYLMCYVWYGPPIRG